VLVGLGYNPVKMAPAILLDVLLAAASGGVELSVPDVGHELIHVHGPEVAPGLL
jgi:hypothetical protein